MSADNGSYVIKTPARNSLGCEFRVGHAQAIENAEWPDIPVRNSYLLSAFGASWVFGRQRRAVALANVLEEEIASGCNGWGTEYGVCVIPVDTPFPHAATTPQQFAADGGVYVLKSPSQYRDGYDFRVAYATSEVVAAVAALNDAGSNLADIQAGAQHLSGTFDRRRGMYFSKRGRAVRAAHLIHDDIVSRGGATANGVTIVEITHSL
jgi:hypothetical protein